MAPPKNTHLFGGGILGGFLGEGGIGGGGRGIGGEGELGGEGGFSGRGDYHVVCHFIFCSICTIPCLPYEIQLL